MKKISVKIAVALCALAGAVAAFSLSSCKRTPEDLKLYGAWEEKHYAVYDTNMASFSSQHRLVLECPGLVTDSLGNPSKEGDFLLFIKSTHKKSLSSYLSGQDSTYVYPEYVKGRYRIDETRCLLDFNGIYYTDSLFSTVADTGNTHFGFGDFQRNAYYRINDKFLILSLNDSLSSPDTHPVDLNHFYPVGEPYKCY